MAQDRNVLYKVDINIGPALTKLSQLNKEFEKVEKVGTRSTRNVSTKGRQQVRQLGFAFQRMGLQGTAAFGEIFAAIGPVGLAIGAVVIPTVLLVKAFKELAIIAVDTLKAMVAASIETGKSFEITRAQFNAIFEDAPIAAEAAFQRVRALSRELGQDLTEVARSFLPEVGSLDELEGVLRIATALARLDPTQGVRGARIALDEFLKEGTTRSLVRRFELSRTRLNDIQEILQSQGLTAGITALEAELERTGRNVEVLADTFEVSIGRVQQVLVDLQGRAGEPILEGLQEGVEPLLEFLEENFNELQTLADAFGSAVGGVIEDLANIGESLLSGVEPEDFRELADELIRTGEAIELIIASLSGGGLNEGENAITALTFVLERVNHRLEQLSGYLVLINALMSAVGQAGVNAFGGILNLINTIRGETAGVELIESLQGTSSLERFNEVIEEGRGKIAEYKEEMVAGTAANRDFADSLEESAASGEALGDALLAARTANEKSRALLGEIEDINEKQGEAQQKVDEKRLDFTIKRQEAEFDLELKHSREKIDLEQKFSEQREDIARKNADAIEDINRKNVQRINDARRDLVRDEEDIARKFSRKRIEIEQEEQQKRIDAEVEFRRRLDEIRRRFEFDAQEAIRANDAIAFLRIQRRLDFEIEEARNAQEEQTEDAVSETQRRRDALEIERQQEIEDAKIKNARLLEDLQIRLNRELEAQAIKHARELEQQAIAEERKRQDLAISQQRQEEDFERAWQRRLEALERNLQRELDLIRRFEREKARIRREARELSRQAARAENRATEIQNQQDRAEQSGTDFTNAPPQSRDGTGSTTGTTDDEVDFTNAPPQSRRFGGPAFPGQLYRVNEPGNPEFFMPGRFGTIVPLSRLLRNFPISPRSVPSVINNTRSSRVDVSMLDPSRFSPAQMHILETLFMDIINRAESQFNA